MLLGEEVTCKIGREGRDLDAEFASVSFAKFLRLVLQESRRVGNAQEASVRGGAHRLPRGKFTPVPVFLPENQSITKLFT